ncbi:MAG: LPXTG cell wall anchor domain-containing protein [Lactobacillales bacterium]|jgi:LPXTG-motif cell wall-anchored protein|nr:LPXTG cell wall anchor domain-containing protein [Lactobacillales bacterium]
MNDIKRKILAIFMLVAMITGTNIGAIVQVAAEAPSAARLNFGLSDTVESYNYDGSAHPVRGINSNPSVALPYSAWVDETIGGIQYSVNGIDGWQREPITSTGETSLTNSGTYYVNYRVFVRVKMIPNSSNWADSITGSKTITINPKNLSVTATPGQSKELGKSDPVFEYSFDGLVEGDTFTGALERDSGYLINDYEIRQGDLSAGTNYTISFTGSTFAINPTANLLAFYEALVATPAPDDIKDFADVDKVVDLTREFEILSDIEKEQARFTFPNVDEHIDEVQKAAGVVNHNIAAGSVDGVDLPWNYRLMVEDGTTHADYGNLAVKLASRNLIRAHNIYLFDVLNETEVQPDSAVKVVLNDVDLVGEVNPILHHYHGDALRVVDGAIFDSENKTLTFETDSFSLFSISVDLSAKAPVIPAIPSTPSGVVEPKVPALETVKKLPVTGTTKALPATNETSSQLLLALGLFAFVSIGFVFRKRVIE